MHISILGLIPKKGCGITSYPLGEVRPTDFVSAAGSIALTDDGRKRFIGTLERRMGQEITHPLFGYKVSYRRLFDILARLLGRSLLNDIPDYPNFTTR